MGLWMAPLGSRRGVDFFKREVRGLLENGSNETYKLSPFYGCTPPFTDFIHSLYSECKAS